jgi:Putative DNA-binding domain
MSVPRPKPSGPGKDLRAIQRAFAAGVTRPLTSKDTMQPEWTDGQSARKAVAAFIKPNDRLTSFDRLEIYNKQYWFRLLDSLYEDFPGLRSVIGDDRFHEMSIAYLNKYPSTSFTLRDLGSKLDKFLAKESHWIAPHEKIARELVRLEWAHIVAFDGDERPPLEVDALLDGANPATLKLSFQPYLTLLACDYPVDDYLLAAKRRAEPRGEASNAVAERVVHKKTKKLKLPQSAKTYIAVHRQDTAVWYKRLEPEACLLCAALQKGLTLEAACERVFRRKKIDENFGAKLQGWFAQWAAFGWFCRAEKDAE